MTSKNSFTKLLKMCISQRLWAIAMSCLVLFFSLPVYAAIYVSRIRNQLIIDGNDYLKYMLNRLYRSRVLGESNGLLMIAVIFLAVFIAINSFSYLFYRQRVDFFHSFPVKRDSLFVANYLSGIITFVVPYIFFTIIAIIIGASYSMIDGTSIRIAMLAVLISIVGFILIYSFSIIAIMLTGNVGVSACGLFVLFAYRYAVMGIKESMCGSFYDTYSYRNGSGVSQLILSPIEIYANAMKSLNSFSTKPGFGVKEFALVIIFAIVSLLIALVLYRIRPSEAAGNSMAFKKSMPVIAVGLLVPAALLGGTIFMEVAGDSFWDTPVWYITGVLITLIIGHFVIQAIYYLDFKSMFKNIINIIVAGVIVAVISIVFIFDLTGYDSYLPKEDNLESIAIASWSLQGSQNYLDFDADLNEYGYRDMYIDNDTYRFEHMHITDKKLALDFAKACVENDELYSIYMRRSDKNDGIAFANETASSKMIGRANGIDGPTAVFYAGKVSDVSDFENRRWTNITIKYNLTNGKSVYRDYDIDIDAIMEKYNALYMTKEYKEGVYEILTDENVMERGKLYVNNGYNQYPLDGWTKKEREALINTYREELLAQDAYELANDVPVASIYVETPVDENGMMNLYNSDYGFVYPSFKKTIAMIEEKGIAMNEAYDPEKVKSIRVENYHWNEAVDEYGNTETSIMEYTDKDDIKLVLDNAYSYEVGGVEDIFHESCGVDVIVTYDDNSVSYEKVVSFGFLKGNMPEKIVADVDYVEE